MEINLYKEPVYRVWYKGLYHRESFELKTLKGCLTRIEREGLKVEFIERVEHHLYDFMEDIIEKVTY